jgi:hypothetical protein
MKILFELLGINYPWGKMIQVCSNEGDCLSTRGDNSKTVKVHWKFKDISFIKIGKNSFPYCGTTRPPGVMILTNLILYYVRRLSCKFQYFWASNYWEQKFLMTPPHFYIFVIISPLKRTWSLIWTNLNSLYPRIICTKFDWIWPADSGKDLFFKHQCIFTLLLLSPLGEGQFPSFEQTWIPSPRMIYGKSG